MQQSGMVMSDIETKPRKHRRWLSISAVVLLALGLVGGTLAYLNPIEIILFLAWLRKDKVEPNHPVAWETGPGQIDAGNRRPPNVIVILADDMGYNGISLNGGGVVPTPNIDSIARAGVEFTNGYAGNATCAPSRAALLTGRYGTRFGFEFTPVPAIYPTLVKRIGMGDAADALHPIIVDEQARRSLPPMDAEAIPKTEITIADRLRSAGYHTLHIGKWHLGGSAGSRPEQKGFDESLGFIAGASLYAPESDPAVENAKVEFDPMERLLWAGASWSVQYNGSKPFKPARYMTDYLTDEAIKAVDANRNRPFFLYFAPNAVHTPLQAPRADYDALPNIKDHTRRVYGAMTRNLDRNIGRLLNEIRALHLDGDTIVVFTSDNGGAHYIGLPEINRPYRGWKATFFEGGLHIPFFMKWPGHIAAGSRFTAPVAQVDIAATAAAAAGTTLPRDRVIDGVDLMPYLRKTKTGDPHAALFWRSGGDTVLMRDGWKLLRSSNPKRTWLYDLRTDPTEQQDLSPKRQQQLQSMLVEMNRISAKQARPIWPSTLSVAVPIDHPLGVPMKASDAYTYWNN